MYLRNESFDSFVKCLVTADSVQSCRTLSALLLGENMRSIDESFYKTRTWRRVQANYMRQAHFFCERCKKKGLMVPAKIVHHKDYLTKADLKNPEKLYSFENLEALCLDCHNAEHFKHERRYEIDKQGKLIFCEDEREKVREYPPTT